MHIKAFISDFDGTIVTHDISDLLCSLVGKEQESKKLNQLFHEGKLKGLEGLVRRINFLQGLSLEQIREVVAADDYLRKGARELFNFLQSRGIVTILASGSILPILELYKEKLGVDYVVGSNPIIQNERIVSISEENYSGADFKVVDCRSILAQLGISYSEVIAMGDSPADKGIFGLAAKTIAINPRGGIEDHADYIIQDDLSLAIPILEDLLLQS